MPEDKQDVVVVLTDLGISEGVAARLATRYSRERIYEKIEYLKFLQAEDPESVQKPRGWLRRAIEQDYARPDGFLTTEERERQQAEAARQDQAEAEQTRIGEEVRRVFVEKRAREEAGRRQALAKAYGTTAADYTFWERAQSEIKCTLPAHIGELVTGVDILKVRGEVVVVGTEREDVWRQLQHPGTQKAINRALRYVAGSEVELQVEAIKNCGFDNTDKLV